MRRLSHFLICLYPRSWRERYGEEFSALIEDVGATWLTVADVMRGAIEMQIQTWSLQKIFLTAGILGVFTLAIAYFAIPDRAVMAVTVSGAANDTAAGDAVMALVSNQFPHASLISVKRVPASLPNNNSRFTVEFKYDSSYAGLEHFVREHSANRAAGDFQILNISSHALHKWLKPLIPVGVIALAIALGVTFRVRAVYRTA